MKCLFLVVLKVTCPVSLCALIWQQLLCTAEEHVAIVRNSYYCQVCIYVGAQWGAWSPGA